MPTKRRGHHLGRQGSLAMQPGIPLLGLLPGIIKLHQDTAMVLFLRLHRLSEQITLSREEALQVACELAAPLSPTPLPTCFTMGWHVTTA